MTFGGGRKSCVMWIDLIDAIWGPSAKIQGCGRRIPAAETLINRLLVTAGRGHVRVRDAPFAIILDQYQGYPVG
jgi:hypothetical protein